ncbi:MAG: type II toxin-antitoxin system prevent-host-death family antitoxin [Bryobacterales bacterium]|nr:type II toxin-antitoxin system prevent-host-death family antitoxin [Bryobacterales bacterium]MDE0262305.1 type II toxin-antitoxin system prevent-host-death family antitoxin [Bryobacterales bacterium]MDE0623307.1 type II toxin-antitoxin system prevent-host-death family antitoxin [Bryobacterales bacterium]
MSMVNIHQAKTQLSRLLVQVEAGEEVVIARNGKPVARLVRFRDRGKRRFGALRGKISIDESFFDPLPESELAAWER